MNEWEALDRRREILLKRISAEAYEIEKIDIRLIFLDKLKRSDDIDLLKEREVYV